MSIKCEHGRRRNTCRDCGGVSICEHGRLRYQCKDCGGASICEHGLQRCRCKDCGGTSVFTSHKSNARARKLLNELTESRYWWLARRECVYCGSTVQVNGVDRVKNEYGYTVLNSVTCCRACNYMKSVLSAPDFLAQASRIATYNPTYDTFKTRWIETRTSGPDLVVTK